LSVASMHGGVGGRSNGRGGLENVGEIVT
jgi:hypothetical protein